MPAPFILFGQTAEGHRFTRDTVSAHHAADGQIILGHLAIAEKSNEIPAAQAMIATLGRKAAYFSESSSFSRTRRWLPVSRAISKVFLTYKGFSYTTAFEMPGLGIQVARGHVDAKGTIAVHDGKQQYILYVISGTGKMTLNDSKGAPLGETTYKPDDVIIFQTNPLHGWVNGDTPFEFLGIDLPPARK
jgi:oxalate decarboxylase/phosphoglucose isomerase-like protein (cupin superfamily)